MAKALSSRASATTAAALEPLSGALQSIDTSMRQNYAQATGKPLEPGPAPYTGGPKNPLEYAQRVGEAALLGKSPIPGVDPRIATDEFLRRTMGDYHAMTPEQADAVSRAALGLPVGEMARAALGTEGVSMALQGPAYSGMNALGGLAFKGATALAGKIPEVRATRAINEIKTSGVRQMLAQQAEQHQQLAPVNRAIQAEAKAQDVAPEIVDARVREAMQLEPMDRGQAMAALTPGEQGIAQGIKDFNASQVAQNVAQGLKPGERHAHIEARRVKALQAIQTAQSGKVPDIRAAKRAVQRFETTVEPSGIAVPRTLQGKIDLPGAEQVLQKTPEMLTGHAPAVPTPEASQAMAEMQGQVRGIPQARNVMSVSQVARIKGNRAITTAEKEAQFQERYKQWAPGKEPPPLAKSLLESTLIRGDQRAASRATAQILQDLSNAPFAKPIVQGVVPKNHIRLDQLNVGKAGFQTAERNRLAQIAIPKRQFRIAQRMLGVMQNPSTLGDAKTAWEKGARFWKQMVLLRTGYTSRNVLDNTITSIQAGAKPEYALWGGKAALLANGAPPELLARLGIDPQAKVPGLGMTLKEYVARARRTGELSGGFISSEAGKTGAARTGIAGAAEKALTGWRDANAILENSARAALGMSKRAAGLSEKEVGQIVDDMLGKYHPAFQSPLERKLTSYGFPWWNWIKQISKRSVRLAIERPGSVAATAQIPTEVNLASGFTPAQVEALGPDVKQSGAFVRPYRGKGARPGDVEVTPTSFYGPTDINRLYGTAEKGPMSVLTNPAQQAYPPIQWLTSIAGFDLFKGKGFTGESVELPKSAQPLLLYPDLARSLGVHRVGSGIFGPDRLNYILRQSGPQAIAIGDLASMDPDSRRRARAFWTGLSSYIRNTGQSAAIQGGAIRKEGRERMDLMRRSNLNQQRFLMNEVRR